MPKIYKMLPIKRPEGAIPIKPPSKIPTIQPNTPKTLYKIVQIDYSTNTATITSNTKQTQLTVIDVDVKRLGVRSVKVGDVLGYESHDVEFENPTIVFRASQSHAHPRQLQ